MKFVRWLALIFALIPSLAWGQAAVTIYCGDNSNPTKYFPASAAFPCPVAVVPGGGSDLTWTQTIVTLTAATSTTLIAANPARKGLIFMDAGNNPFTFAPGTGSVVAGSGLSLNGNSGAGTQGSAYDFSSEVSGQAFSGISTGGTTVAVWE